MEGWQLRAAFRPFWRSYRKRFATSNQFFTLKLVAREKRNCASA
jgi:hypothetical protein